MVVSDRIISGFKATLGARLINNVANGLLMFLLASVLLSPNEYGLLFLVIAIIGVAQLFADLGLSRSAARYVSEYKEINPSRVPFLLRSSLKYRLVLLWIVGSVLLIGRDAIAWVQDTPELSLLLVFGVGYLVFSSLYSYFMTLFQGFNRVDLSAVVEVANNLSRFVLVVVLTVAGFGVVGALVGYIAGFLLATAIGLVVCYHQFYAVYEDGGGTRSLRNRMLKYSVPLTASHSANVLTRHVDTVLIGFFLNPIAVGYYVLSKQIIEFTLVPAASLGFSVSPSYSERKANDALESAARLYEQTMQSVLLLYIPAAVGIVIVAEPAITLVFAEYGGAVPVLQILSIYIIFQAITDITTHSLDYLGRAKQRAIAKGVTAVANVILNIILIPLYGVPGAAVATVLTFGTYTMFNVYIMSLELPLNLRRLSRSLALTAVISVGMGVTVWLLVPYVSGVLTLVGVIAVGILIWATLATMSGIINPRKTISMLT